MLLVLGLALSTAHPLGAQVFEKLEGDWEGTGTLLGRAAAFRMSWERAGDGFVRLAFENAFVDDQGARTPVLTAEAVYLVRDSTAVGVWIDSRPQRIRLDAEVTATHVLTTWTAESERGRTEYVVEADGGVVVRDYVEATEGLRLFGEARYRRSPAGGG